MDDQEKFFNVKNAFYWRISLFAIFGGGGGIEEIQPPSAQYEPYALSTMYYEIVMNSEFI